MVAHFNKLIARLINQDAHIPVFNKKRDGGTFYDVSFPLLFSTVFDWSLARNILCQLLQRLLRRFHFPLAVHFLRHRSFPLRIHSLPFYTGPGINVRPRFWQKAIILAIIFQVKSALTCLHNPLATANDKRLLWMCVSRFSKKFFFPHHHWALV